MAYKYLIAGILILSTQTGFSADATTATDNSQTDQSADQTDKPVQPVTQGNQTPDKEPGKTSGKKPTEEASEPDCD